MPGGRGERRGCRCFPIAFSLHARYGRELWTVAGGVYASKPWPALILQDDLFEGTASVTVAPLTSAVVDAPLLRVRAGADEVTGLRHQSHVMVDNR
ncbi:type II toxin-antitoxin system PemK/MazF family toxin [Ornithinimicrobium cavernae]|uniref:type II toxin-antitoxin system PemK/MazF family toxin n=1 Tax=Ornithinimicrobium cavernae TaxID=2666047 RepID=UPI00192A1B83